MNFDYQFPRLPEEDYKRAAAIADKVRSMVKGMGDVDSVGPATKPSFIWELISLLTYAFYPTYDLINTWRLHTELFTGNNMIPFVEAHYHPLPKKLANRYRVRTQGLPNEIIARPPRICGECGWEINGGIVNDDVLMYQRHLTTMYFHGIIDRLKDIERPLILEIGGGYGALAYFLKKILPNAKYYMVDLTESLLFAAVYLQVTMPEHVTVKSVYDGTNSEALNPKNSDIVFIPNSLMNDIPKDLKFDIVINTGSFGEMFSEQIEIYRDFTADHLAKHGVLYEENQDTTFPVTKILKEKFVYLPAEGQQRIWAKNKEVLNALKPYKEKIMSAQSASFRARRRSFEWSSRAIRKFPRLKRIAKKVVGSY